MAKRAVFCKDDNGVTIEVRRPTGDGFYVRWGHEPIYSYPAQLRRLRIVASDLIERIDRELEELNREQPNAE